MRDAADASTRRLMVFSHPNHELAVYGFCHRVRPWFVFLTDGGGERRVAETRAGLAAAGLEDRAHFLDHTESALYAALLDRDHGFYSAIGHQVGRIVAELEPTEIYCDAIELYNPVHDMALPVVRAAAPAFEALFEVPLIYEVPGEGRSYRVQRALPGRPHTAIDLEPHELAAKRRARDTIYGALGEDLGSTIAGLDEDDLAREELAAARRDLSAPPEGCALRYERRGRLLQERGEVERVITRGGHYAPLVEALVAA